MTEAEEAEEDYLDIEEILAPPTLTGRPRAVGRSKIELE